MINYASQIARNGQPATIYFIFARLQSYTIKTASSSHEAITAKKKSSSGPQDSFRSDQEKEERLKGYFCSLKLRNMQCRLTKSY